MINTLSPEKKIKTNDLNNIPVYVRFSLSNTKFNR
jgi:hypothetical protein